MGIARLAVSMDGADRGDTRGCSPHQRRRNARDVHACLGAHREGPRDASTPPSGHSSGPRAIRRGALPTGGGRGCGPTRLRRAPGARLMSRPHPVPPASTASPAALIAQDFGGDNACTGVPPFDPRVLRAGAETYDGGERSVSNIGVGVLAAPPASPPGASRSADRPLSQAVAATREVVGRAADGRAVCRVVARCHRPDAATDGKRAGGVGARICRRITTASARGSGPDLGQPPRRSWARSTMHCGSAAAVDGGAGRAGPGRRGRRGRGIPDAKAVGQLAVELDREPRRARRCRGTHRIPARVLAGATVQGAQGTRSASARRGEEESWGWDPSRVCPLTTESDLDHTGFGAGQQLAVVQAWTLMLRETEKPPSRRCCDDPDARSRAGLYG
jgi:hypothetical protein